MPLGQHNQSMGFLLKIILFGVAIYAVWKTFARWKGLYDRFIGNPQEPARSRATPKPHRRRAPSSDVQVNARRVVIEDTVQCAGCGPISRPLRRNAASAAASGDNAGRTSPWTDRTEQCCGVCLPTFVEKGSALMFIDIDASRACAISIGHLRPCSACSRLVHGRQTTTGGRAERAETPFRAPIAVRKNYRSPWPAPAQYRVVSLRIGPMPWLAAVGHGA